MEGALDPGFREFDKYKTMREEMREPTWEPNLGAKRLVSTRKDNFLKTKTYSFELSLGKKLTVKPTVPTCSFSQASKRDFQVALASPDGFP